MALAPRRVAPLATTLFFATTTQIRILNHLVPPLSPSATSFVCDLAILFLPWLTFQRSSFLHLGIRYDPATLVACQKPTAES